MNDEELKIQTRRKDRMMIAAMALQGLCANPFLKDVTDWERAIDSVNLADELLKRLEATQ